MIYKNGMGKYIEADDKYLISTIAAFLEAPFVNHF